MRRHQTTNPANKIMKNMRPAEKIKAISFLLAFAILVTVLCSCGYKQIEGTEEELAVVGKVGGYDVKYEELRYITVLHKKQMAITYGADIWASEETADKYRSELESAVYSAIRQDYAVQALAAEVGYKITDPDVVNRTTEYVSEFVKEIGGMGKYREYLKENCMTDSFFRMSMATDILESQLKYTYTEIGYITTDYEEIYDAIISKDMFLRTVHIFISDDKEGRSAAEAEAIANAAYAELENGADFSDVMKKYNEDSEQDADTGMYFTYGEADEAYENATRDLSFDKYSKVIHTGGGYLIIKRERPDVQYVMMNMSSLAERYQYSVLQTFIDDKKSNMKFEPNDFGSGIDLTKID